MSILRCGLLAIRHDTALLQLRADVRQSDRENLFCKGINENNQFIVYQPVVRKYFKPYTYQRRDKLFSKANSTIQWLVKKFRCRHF